MKKLLWLCCLVFLTVFAVQPAEAGLISKEEEINMGRDTARQLEAQYGVYQDPAAQERVNRIGQSLVAVCGRKDLPYTFKILNADEINALSCPGGFVYVFRGLLDYMPSDAELAGVLGHEIGHVVKRHTVNQIEKNMWTTIGLIIATGGRDIGLASMASQALAAGYSRTDERGADKEGFAYSVRAGYNPYSMLLTLRKLDDLAQQQKTPSYGLWNDHPEPEERVAMITKMLAPLQIKPAVSVNKDGSATVSEGSWSFNILSGHGNDKPEYRALALAGGLWCVRQRGQVDPNRFIVDDEGQEAILYYDDIQLLTVYAQDAGSFGSAGAYASACTDLLRQWAAQVNAAGTYGKVTTAADKKTVTKKTAAAAEKKTVTTEKKVLTTEPKTTAAAKKAA
jgi:Zn-dependent protease with chaperone function